MGVPIDQAVLVLRKEPGPTLQVCNVRLRHQSGGREMAEMVWRGAEGPPAGLEGKYEG